MKPTKSTIYEIFKIMLMATLLKKFDYFVL